MKLNRIILFFLFISVSFFAEAQYYPSNTFQKLIDDDFTCYESQGGVAMASDRGYIVSGYRRNCTSGGWSAFLMKTDFAGNVQFARDLGSSPQTQFIDAVTSSDKSIVAVGNYQQSTADNDILVVKFDSCGTVKWQKRYGNTYADVANHIIRTSDGNYAIAGWTATGTATTDRDMLLLKIQDSDGALLGSYSYGAAGTTEFAIDVIQTSDGGFALIGTQRPSFPYVSVLKLTNTGVVTWSRSYNLRVNNGDNTYYNSGAGKKVMQTSDNNLVVVIAGTGPFAEGGSRTGLMKINILNGNPIWNKNYKIDINPNQQTGIYGGCLAADGGFALLGYTAKRTQNINLMELYIMKTDADGSVTWANTYGKTNRQHLQSGYTQEYGGKLVMTPDSGFVFSATMTHAGLTNPENLWLVKTDKFGRAPDCNINYIPILTDISTPTTSAGLTLKAYTPSSPATSCTLTTPSITNFNAICNGVIYTPKDSVVSAGIYGPVNACPGTYNYIVPDLGKGYTYTWTVTGGGSIQSGNGTPAIKVNITANATVNLTIKGNCNYITTLSLNVNVVSASSISVTPNPASICNGSSVELTASGASEYTWSPSTGLSSTTGATVTASPINSITYTVIGKIQDCSGTAKAVVNVINTPSLTAKANNTANIYSVCPRILPTAIALTSNAEGGGNCTGSWAYCWSNGLKYWDGTGFNSATAVYNPGYANININVSDSTSYTVTVHCDDDVSCSNTSTVIVIPLKTPGNINAIIGNPANGLSHYMHVSWEKIIGAYYEIEYSKNAKTWQPTAFTGKNNFYEYNTGDYPNDSAYFRVKTWYGSAGCDYREMQAPKFTACDYPNLVLSNPIGNSIDFTLMDESPVANPLYTEYSVKCQSCSPPNQFVQADGTLGANEIFQTKGQWGIKTITGLKLSTEYCFYASAKNKDGDIRTEGPSKTVCMTTSGECYKPSITSQTMGPIYRCSGDTVRFKVKATGNSPLAYQWVKGENADIVNATNSVLSLSNISKSADENIYFCRISNICGAISSESVVLIINLPPVINIASLIIHKNAGESVHFDLSPGGTPPFTYIWYKDGTEISGATSNNYHISSITTNDAGIYTCRISNSCGYVKVKVATLIVGSSNLLYGQLTYNNKTSTPLTKSYVIINNIENTLKDSVITDSTGHYQFNPIPGGQYIISGKTTKNWGGVNPIDALIVNRYFIGQYTFIDKLKEKAADVNNDEKINPLDALTINRRYIGLTNSFPAGNWVFEKDTLTVNSDIEQNFKGICVGDADGSYAPPLKKMADINLIENAELRIENDGVYYVPVSVTRDIELGAIGLKFKVTSSKFKVLDIASDIDGLIYNISSGFGVQGSELSDKYQQSTDYFQLISIAWSALEEPLKLKAGQHIFKLKVKFNNEQLSTINKQLITIDPSSVLADYYANRLSGETLSMPSLSVQSSNFRVQSFPNPFNNTTTIEYEIPNACNISLKVFNILGIEIRELVNSYMEAGNYKVKFNGSDLPAGAYVYRFEAKGINNNFSQTKILLISR